MNKVFSTPSQLAIYSSMEKWQFPNHIRKIESNILKLLNRRYNGLIVNMPPRHGKSEYISKYFPFWYLCTQSNKRVILTAYGSKLAEGFGLSIKHLIQNYGEELFDVKLVKGNHENLILSNGSELFCTGAGGSLTGRGADLLIIDDPIKNDTEAMSTHKRDSNYEWFLSTAYTRLEPGGKFVIAMTRWHRNDLSGLLIRHNFPKLLHLLMPAISQNKKALWRSRFNLKKLNEIKQVIGSHWFSALYQQSPRNNENSVFDLSKIKYYNKEVVNSKDYFGKNVKRYISTDLSTGIGADYSCYIIFSIDQHNNIYIEEMVRTKCQAYLHANQLKNLYLQHDIDMIGIETVGYQMTLYQQLASWGVPVFKYKSNNDKVTRALQMAALVDVGKVHLPENVNWLKTFLDELSDFPNAGNDDIVDAFSYIHQFINIGGGFLPIGRK